MASFLYVNGQQIPSGYTITIYKYEPFSYLFTPPPPVGSTGYLVLSSTSTLLTSLVRQASLTDIEFNSPGYVPWDPQTRGYTGATSTTEQIVIGYGTSIVSGGGVVVEQTAIVNVIIKAGRFVLPVLTAPSYNLFVNEPVASTLGSAIRFQAPGNLAVTTPFTTPALPPGLSFVPVGASPSLNWDLTGTPATGFPPTLYTVYARGALNPSFVISKTFTITVGSERIVTGASPSSNISMVVGTPITTTTITASYPGGFTSNLSYAWSFLPDGLQFTDGSGNAVTSPFRPGDSNSTMILSGTPSEAAAQLYRGAGVSNITTNVVATRQTAPALTATQPLNLSFGPTVLFDTFSIPRLYVNKAIDPSSISVQANTYFPFSSGMASIVATTLPAGLSLVHTPGSSVAYLSGTPTSAVSNTYAITATNSNGVSQTSNATIQVVADTIAFTGPVTDTCYNFVISRPLTQSLTGYYPSNIAYTATAASGANVVVSVTNLSNVGISTTIVGSSLTLGGIPDTVTGLTTAVITATAPSTGATNSLNLKYEILTDDISLSNPPGPVFPTPQLTFFQNKEITPVRFTASTLSGRSVVNWTSSNLPTGLSLSTLGVLTGTPVSNTFAVPSFNVIASTGYVSQSLQVSYRTVADDILIALITDPSTVSEQFSNVEYRAVTYSGFTTTASVGDIQPLQTDPITLSFSGNYLSGDLGTAKGILPEYKVRFDASYGLLNAQQQYHLVVSNANTQRRLILDASLSSAFSPPNLPKGVMGLYKNEQKTLTFTPLNYNILTPSNWTPVLTTSNVDYGYIGDMAQSSNTCIMVAGATMYRSVDGGNQWTTIPGTDISTIPGILGFYQTIPPHGLITTPGPILTTVASDGNSNWLVLGVGYDSNLAGAQRTILRTSSNDGQTWVDVSLTSTFVDRDASNRLFYNNGRYFLSQNKPGDSSYRADASNLSVWTGPAGGMPLFNDAAYTFAFSNNVALCGGSGGATVDPLYVSSNNGTTWSPVSGIPISESIRSIARTGSNWYALTDTDVYFSSNAPNFTLGVSGYAGGWQSIDFDGSVFNAYGYGTFNIDVYSFPFNMFCNVPGYTANVLTRTLLKRAMTRFIDNGPVTATLSLFSSNLPFAEPTVTDYSFLQYAPVRIPVEGVPPSGQFTYYYATDLPQGISLVLDSSGILADISGIPTLYDPNPKQFFIFAREPIVPYVGRIPISYRVLSPFVLKPQTSAAGYTAYLRQYVEVNGAQNARDAVAFPVQENPIGKFTSPGIGDVVTDSNCPC